MEAEQEIWMKAQVPGETAVELKLGRAVPCSLIEILPGWQAQSVAANGVSSSHQMVTTGVPKCSVLGPSVLMALSIIWTRGSNAPSDSL